MEYAGAGPVLCGGAGEEMQFRVRGTSLSSRLKSRIEVVARSLSFSRSPLAYKSHASSASYTALKLNPSVKASCPSFTSIPFPGSQIPLLLGEIEIEIGEPLRTLCWAIREDFDLRFEKHRSGGRASDPANSSRVQFSRSLWDLFRRRDRMILLLFLHLRFDRPLLLLVRHACRRRHKAWSGGDIGKEKI
ncbi:uncharacterized protein LOC122010933 [Zingiber officinale]|uniref:uncharacterized protein LOC122010933 n=1 Tax=Zingiber officinale TaxID=94328 RepID=UPI001C4D6A75|nr:uncharacterized protein LOC122010933 [Zingiber officinale]